MKKILLICGASQSVINFRCNLIKDLMAKDYQVSVIAMDSEFEKEIKQLGCEFYYSDFTDNRQTNPFKLFRLQKFYRNVIRQVKPDVVMTFMLKPNTFGVFAAKKEKVAKIFSAVEGAGDVFIYNTFKWRFIRSVVCKLMKRSFKYVEKVIFENEDDRTEFIEKKLITKEKSLTIYGIGVDTEKFAFKPLVTNNQFLMVARMLKTKGIFEFCKCARLVRSKYPQAEFNYLGVESAVTLSDIDEYVKDGSIKYLGTTKDVMSVIDKNMVLVLGSYREGMPVSVMEAQSVGRPVIVSNAIGCKDTVKDGYNGFICEVGDYQTMAEKAIWFIENPDKTIEMGKNAREFAESHFDVNKINKIIIEAIQA